MILSQIKAYSLKCPRMDSNQNLNVWSFIKFSIFYANVIKMSQALSGTICPYTVLLFEPRISYPALRVTLINFLFRFGRFLQQLAKKFAKKIEKIKFFKFSNFVIFFPKFFESLSELLT